jgi:hypothetical protein
MICIVCAEGPVTVGVFGDCSCLGTCWRMHVGCDETFSVAAAMRLTPHQDMWIRHVLQIPLVEYQAFCHWSRGVVTSASCSLLDGSGSDMLAASAVGCAYQMRTAVSMQTTMWRLTDLIGASVSWAPTDLQRAHVKLRLARFDAWHQSGDSTVYRTSSGQGGRPKLCDVVQAER